MAYKVVVVEDEPQVAELLRLILRHAEIEVFVALDGKSGLDMIRQVGPDLVVLDIMMPNMNGWEVYDAIRSEASLKHIPVIVETVLPERPERKQTFALSDIDYYFTKPFDTTRLRREVGRMLGNEQLWPPPKTRTLLPLPDSATGDFTVMLEPGKIEPPEPEAPPPAAPASPPDQVAAAAPKSQPEPAKADPLTPEAPPPAAPASPPGQVVAAAPKGSSEPAKTGSPPVEGNLDQTAQKS
jgi:two-component system response regulator VicR